MRNTSAKIAILLLLAILFTLPGCQSAQAGDLMSGVTPAKVSGRPADEAFTGQMADFSVELFKKSVAEDESALISPLSVMLALAMAANGADNATLEQMQTLLGGDIPIDELNEYLYSYVKTLSSSKKSEIKTANSIWFRDEKDVLQVKSDFLKANADYYGAAAHKAPFNSRTVSDINDWVKKNTNGMVDKILTEIEADALLYLINAVIFEAEWKNVYYKENVRNGDFTDITGTVQNVKLMHSTESRYLDDGMGIGFAKPYVSGYSFIALLPNEGVTIEEYIGSLTGAGFVNTLENAEATTVYASMPKFEYEYTISMNDALAALGMGDAFDINKADFSRMASSSYDNIYINKVLHKAHIQVDEIGTKAGAVTMVSMAGGASGPMDAKTVRLDRPFVYAIIDDATNLPIFIGTFLTAE